MRSLAALVGLGALVGLLSACGGDPEPASTPPAKGTASLRFSASSGVRSSKNLVDPLKGAVYGNIYLSEDVSVAGPREGAVEFANVEVMAVDLEAADPSEATWTTPPLDPNRYVFLGMLDADGNGLETRDPDAGDPVTLPFTNHFDIVSDQEIESTVIFDLVYN